MPTSWSRPQTARLAASAGLLLAQGAVAAGFDAANNIALYWGQNSYNQAEGNLTQQSLATYCANTDVDIIPMAFAVQLTTGGGGQPVINLANSGDKCSTFNGTTTLDCPSVGDDIKTCQEKYNKTILLSIGGATYTEGGFKTEEDAVKAANLIWNTFGPVEAAGLPSNTSTGNGTDAPTRNDSTSLAGSGYNATTGPLSTGQLRTSTFGTGTARSGEPADITATPGPYANTTIARSTLGTDRAGTGRTGSLTDATATPAPYSNRTTTGASLRTGNATGTRTGPITATLLVGNMTATLILENDAVNDTAASRSSDPVYSSINTDPILPGGATGGSTDGSDAAPTTDPILPGGSTDRSGAALTTGTITSMQSYLSLTAQSYNDTQTSTPAQAQADATVRAETYLNDDDVFTTSPKTTRTTLETLTRASIAAAKTVTAETLNYDATHPKRQSMTLRPFGSSSVNGFDLDLESPTTNFLAFATRLRSLMDTHQKVHRSASPFYLTAAPQCPYPDAALNPVLSSNVIFDALFVQFYNNYCGVQSFIPNTTNQTNFNFATWDNWAKNGSANPDVKIFLGVPAGQTAAGSGYRNATELGPVLEYAKTFESFGGVMAWDASQAYANKGFLEGVKAAMGSANGTTARNSTNVSVKRARYIRRGIRGQWRPRCRDVGECL
ncbi:Class III chitinase [Fulvia fulva]|uniref:Class III chitinase n=1 Tax=Passalora fulva TaxID=5499 RepID=A0A9Q8PJH3_PASFU|nr:Class III chitinase [Fulvia fulva]KAK4611519.1 Class III chitinase [Fulvia fulva]KAK4612685.1 Class III chitinase [Fulvia fulva]UJO23676.1 Class III chitinase [Fulvia fulva]WPV21346.1 Class III chitinase [Fulvia fulva]WPV35847.1 Class III chitinase [Fulvia fulva]